MLDNSVLLGEAVLFKKTALAISNWARLFFYEQILDRMALSQTTVKLKEVIDPTSSLYT